MSLDRLPIFVYGTLQLGEERAPLWPAQPLSVESATLRGALFDLGPYPALIPGHDCVCGELWHIAAEDLARTLRVLDQIEGFGQPGQADWYVRKVVTCRTAAEPACRAYTYFYAHPERLEPALAVLPDEAGRVHWHRFRPKVH